MSDVNHPTDNDVLDDALFDRLVDDELSAEARRKLLASLDDEPGGWRRCAMAFLEAQALRRSFGALLQAPPCENASATPRAVSSGSKTQSPRGASASLRVAETMRTDSQSQMNSVWKPIGLAAGIMLAFTLGSLLPNRNGTIEQANAPIPLNHAAPDGALVDSGMRPVGPMHVGRENFAPQPGAPRSATNAEDSLLLLVGGEGTPEQQIRVPLIESEAMNDQFGRYIPPPVPETLRRRLEQSGYRVESQRRFAPVAGQGGEQMVFPVDDMRIVPIEREVY